MRSFPLLTPSISDRAPTQGFSEHCIDLSRHFVRFNWASAGCFPIYGV
jgi:hypothetical protein